MCVGRVTRWKCNKSVNLYKNTDCVTSIYAFFFQFDLSMVVLTIRRPSCDTIGAFPSCLELFKNLNVVKKKTGDGNNYTWKKTLKYG